MSTTTCPVLRPTLKEFSSFRKYLKTIERYSDYGIVKVIPPEGWFYPQYDMEKIKRMVISSPISQMVNRTCTGVYNLGLLEEENLTVEQYISFSERNSCDSTDMVDRERKFWRSMGFNGGLDDPKYGADMVGSLFGDDPASSWNVNNLDSPLQLLGNDLPGVSNAMLYFGSWRAMFAFHTEDMELYSINYVHIGDPKSWYSIPPKYKVRFESAAQSYFPQEYRQCRQFLRHKLYIFSPTKLKELGIEYNTIVQNAGEFVITFPGAYHAGFNHGFNIAEATNFATRKWLSNGRLAKSCACKPDSVTIDMDLFETMMRRDSRQRAQLRRFHEAAIRARGGGTLQEVAGGDGHLEEELEEEEDDDADRDADGNLGWLLRCSCGKRRLYAADEGAAEGLVFLCAECGAWCHVACTYGCGATSDGTETAGSEGVVPPYALCHLCQRINSSMFEGGVEEGPRGEEGGAGPAASPESGAGKGAGSRRYGAAKRTSKVTAGVTVRIGDIVSVQTTPKVGDRSRLEAGQSLIAILGKVTDILDSHVRIHQMNTRRDQDYWVNSSDLEVLEPSTSSAHHDDGAGRSGRVRGKSKRRLIDAGSEGGDMEPRHELLGGHCLLPEPNRSPSPKKYRARRPNSFAEGGENLYTVRDVGCQVDLSITGGGPLVRPLAALPQTGTESGTVCVANVGAGVVAIRYGQQGEADQFEVISSSSDALGRGKSSSVWWTGERWIVRNGSPAAAGSNEEGDGVDGGECKDMSASGAIYCDPSC